MNIPSCPTICCIRRRVLSLSVSANFTTRLEEAPWARREETERGGRGEAEPAVGQGGTGQSRQQRGRGAEEQTLEWKCSAAAWDVGCALPPPPPHVPPFPSHNCTQLCLCSPPSCPQAAPTQQAVRLPEVTAQRAGRAQWVTQPHALHGAQPTAPEAPPPPTEEGRQCAQAPEPGLLPCCQQVHTLYTDSQPDPWLSVCSL